MISISVELGHSINCLSSPPELLKILRKRQKCNSWARNISPSLPIKLILENGGYNCSKCLSLCRNSEIQLYSLLKASWTPQGLFMGGACTLSLSIGQVQLREMFPMCRFFSQEKGLIYDTHFLLPNLSHILSYFFLANEWMRGQGSRNAVLRQLLLHGRTYFQKRHFS